MTQGPQELHSHGRLREATLPAGAGVATTCSYQATHAGFQRAGFSPAEAEELFRRSMRLAAAARDEFWAAFEAQARCPVPAAAGRRDTAKAVDDCGSLQAQADAREDDSGAQEARGRRPRRPRPLVAFSCGPYAAYLADGSEYTGAYVDSMSQEQLLDFHRRKLQVCLAVPYRHLSPRNEQQC